MIGASAAVYGIVGAQVYTGLVSKRHPASMDSFTTLFWLGLLATEILATPYTLDRVALLFEDSIDHASHVFGFAGGFVLAACWEGWHQRRAFPTRKA